MNAPHASLCLAFSLSALKGQSPGPARARGWLKLMAWAQDHRLGDTGPDLSEKPLSLPPTGFLWWRNFPDVKVMGDAHDGYHLFPMWAHPPLLPLLPLLLAPVLIQPHSAAGIPSTPDSCF